MIKLMVGAVGTGKTKTLIENVNKAASASKGYVVCLEWGDKLRFDISCHVRLIDMQEYGINTADKLYGFISGVLASNYDATDLFIDSALKMCEGQEELVKVFEKINPMLEKSGVNCFVTASLPTEKTISALEAYTK